MGTRNLTVVKYKGDYKIAQYGQWDGYPRGQGDTVLKFLAKWDREKFEKKLAALSFYTEEDLKELEKEYDQIGEKTYFLKYPQTDRDIGAGILQLVYTSKLGMKLVNNIDFASDSLFCEWAYVLDLDKNVFEVYYGFNKQPLPKGAKFADLEIARLVKSDGTKFYQIRLLKSYPLKKPPTLDKLELDTQKQLQKLDKLE